MEFNDKIKSYEKIKDAELDKSLEKDVCPFCGEYTKERICEDEELQEDEEEEDE